MRVDLLFTCAHAQPDVAAANHRLVAVVSAQVKPKAAAGFGDGVAGLVQPVSGGPGDADRDLFTLIHLMAPRKTWDKMASCPTDFHRFRAIFIYFGRCQSRMRRFNLPAQWLSFAL